MVIITGSALAQILTIISAPILTRLYTPVDFGVLAYYTSILGILTPIMTLRYEMAIVLPNKKTDASNIFFLSIFFTVLITIVLFLVNPFVGPLLSSLLDAPQLTKWLWFMPISAFFIGLYKTLEYWSTRYKKYKRISYSRVIRSSGLISSQLIGGWFKVGTIGLIGGQILGQILATIYLLKKVTPNIDTEVLGSKNIKSVKSLAIKYKDFPLFSSTQAFVNAISQNMAPFILGAFFGPAVVGYYALALKLVKLPANLLSESIKQVYYQKISEAYNNGKKLSNSLVKMTISLSIFAFIPALILFLFSPSLFIFTLGEEWIEAGQYSRWIVIWLYFGFINRPSVAIIQVFMMQRILLTYEMILFTIRVVAMIWVALNYNAVASIAVYSIIGGIFNAILILVTIILTMKKERGKI
nr:oligosaccharide flippase family protein [Evansella tamaricis]